jgi:hypothetical protein
VSQTRRRALIGALALAALPVAARASAAPALHVYRSAGCGCCGAWMEHMRRAGFVVTATETDDLDPIKARLGVPSDLASCHTATVGGYVVEGHVPGSDVLRLLAEKPKAIGLAVPGMPIGSPGMEQGATREPYAVLLFAPAGRRVFARH